MKIKWFRNTCPASHAIKSYFFYLQEAKTEFFDVFSVFKQDSINSMDRNEIAKSILYWF
jgi:L-rhamnose mutarotase